MTFAGSRMHRVIPCLLLRGRRVVKTLRFKDPVYVGDPINAVRILNEKEADELLLCDIGATPEDRPPQFDLLAELTSECFMPLCYAGGVRSLKDMERLFGIGVEKIAASTQAVLDPTFISSAAREFGSQSVVAVLDVRRTWRGRYDVTVRGGRKRTGRDPVTVARQMEEAGAGELVLNSVDRDGTMTGFDLPLVERVASAVGIPVVASGGARTLSDLRSVVVEAGAAAVAAGSMFVFQGSRRAVLVSYPSRVELDGLFDASVAGGR